ncbi:Tm-1-like ATP-binding domain-containing protein [Pontibacter saemangeumensis]|uniref:Tm-1-like ATP-binding domain-containing protein n=2 Tax=Pontibacter saemangeumensis TaxID=1084525 RepID=A0ABP8M3X5_9BACT
MLGCFDTKGEVFSFLRQCLLAQGEAVLAVNTGVMGTTENYPVDIEADLLAKEAGFSISGLREAADRGHAVQVMGKGAALVVARLVAEGRIKGAIGMGGGGGTYIALSAMQSIPLGIPKLCLSTIAAKDLSRQVGNKDITLMPSVVDVAGLNSISRLLIAQAAAAICAMANVQPTEDAVRAGSIAISMFGNTTSCVKHCTALLEKQGYEVLAFHATGVGGRTMEALIREGCFDAVLDITTTELADELCGGICSAGPDRLSAAAEMGIPQVVVPGCLDMVNFAQPDTVPEQYKSRQLYSWAPDVTLMRTNEAENRLLGEELARKVSRSTAAAVLLPLRGISQVDAVGGVFHRPDIDQVLFDAIKEHTDEQVPVMEVDAHINDKAFAGTAVKVLLDLVAKSKARQQQ